MQSSTLVILLFALVASSNIQGLPVDSFVQARTSSSLIDYMMKPKVYAVGPTVTAQCFNLYLPVINNIANTFSVQYQACITLAQQRMQSLNAQALGNQTLFEQQVEAICSAYDACNSDTNMLDFFNCYASVSSQDTTIIYNLGIDANTAANLLTLNIQSIQNDQYQCTNTTENTYITATADTYLMLDNCLQNGLPDITITTTPAGEVTSAGPAEGTTEAPGSGTTLFDFTVTV